MCLSKRPKPGCATGKNFGQLIWAKALARSGQASDDRLVYHRKAANWALIFKGFIGFSFSSWPGKPTPMG
jgi:hypothetical protein